MSTKSRFGFVQKKIVGKSFYDLFPLETNEGKDVIYITNKLKCRPISEGFLQLEVDQDLKNFINKLIEDTKDDIKEISDYQIGTEVDLSKLFIKSIKNSVVNTEVLNVKIIKSYVGKDVNNYKYLTLKCALRFKGLVTIGRRISFITQILEGI